MPNIVYENICKLETALHFFTLTALAADLFLIAFFLAF